ncbi:MAG: N-acetyltransferase [Alphaproteobacteria bacterium]
MTITFALEAPSHGAAVQQLLHSAFDADWPNRPASRLRAGMAPLPDLCRVACEGGGLVGVIRHYAVAFGTARLPGLMLGPVAVLPAVRGQGVARALIRASLAHARALDWRRVLLVGDPAYYGKLGFEMAAPHGLTLAGGDDRLMVRALVPGGLDGIAGPITAGGWVRWAA